MDFTIRFVVRPHRQAEFELEPKVVHVRTRDFREKLESPQVDLVTGIRAQKRT